MGNKKPIKLITWQKGILVLVAVCGSVALSTYRTYISKGHLDKIDIISMVFAMLMCISICAGVAWWGNRPEKED